ncbi:tyrosine-type recombinase/integrase [Altererythrobacter arenosus]|uniref:Tyrosine-type recombinase/integrase n=1 Tax=Altererythrobacter arenosus TaxID=3032592 RepID=A0ABY8FPF1_9SPHN|nr:site-specific integrase [Altererythrobacter sp. CAU 1644]WFL76150.1 tyrosine-type recombinase/integrase [Altererythrobacter sp. CAU 1644]
MPKRKLDAAFCQTATCQYGKKKTDYWDTETTGFVFEVRASGGKTYYLRYIDPNQRQRQVKIGRFEDITFAQARKAAQRLRSEVVLDGNPAERKEKKKATPTYAELAKQHLDHARTYQKRPENTEAVLRTHLIPKWGKYRLDEITQQEISKWLAEKRQEFAPATVEKLRMMLGRSFELGRQWNISGAEINPVRAVPRFKFDNARERYLSAEEAGRLLKACKGSSNPQLWAIVSLLLYTGARKSELLHARWEHVDLERRSWLIPDSKTGKARRVPLSGPAAKVLEGLVRIPGCPWLVPNPLTRKPYSGLKQAWATAIKTAGLPGLRIHDLRHSAASFMINSGVDLFAVGKILGHGDHQSTMRYSHLANDTLMAAVEAGAAKLGEAA